MAQATTDGIHGGGGSDYASKTHAFLEVLHQGAERFEVASNDPYPGVHIIGIGEEEDDDQINAVQGITRLRMTINSGAVKHVTHFSTLPSVIKFIPNATGKHFSGAGGETFWRFCE